MGKLLYRVWICLERGIFRTPPRHLETPERAPLSPYQVPLCPLQDVSRPDEATHCNFSPYEELLLCPRSEGALGHSVFTIKAFATQTECQSLIAASKRVLASYTRGPDETHARERLPLVTKLDQTLLLRLFHVLEVQLPDLCEAIFGQRDHLKGMARRFSPGEPAVNIYTAGGEFAPHTDKEHLTLLMPLDAPGAFSGGGTAFWSGSHHAPRPDGYVASIEEEGDRRLWLPHDHVIKALAGTAVIFGGSVTHAGLPVTAGTRHVFVMSFTLRKRDAQVTPTEVVADIVVSDVVACGSEEIGADADWEALDEFTDLFL